jgi:hypothetical protein
MPNAINKQNYTHGLTSKFMFWIWILTIVGEFDFRTKKKGNETLETIFQIVKP